MVAKAGTFPIYLHSNNYATGQVAPSNSFLAPIQTDSTEPIKNLNINYVRSINYQPLEAKLLHMLKSNKPVVMVIGNSKSGEAIEGWYFPGKSNKNALVIGGVHGSELSSIDVAQKLVAKLQDQPTLSYNVLVIPCLFPDNAKLAMQLPARIGSKENIGRYSFKDAVDPNRQMPSLGSPFSPETEEDHFKRKMEPENALLLHLIQLLGPRRMVSLHAIRDKSKAGVFADPRTDSKGIALGFAEDSILAITMAKYIETQGGSAPSNLLNGNASARYPLDPEIVPAGTLQPRSSCGSVLPNNKGCGISLGSWASTAVDDTVNSLYSRPSITIITIEFPGLHRPADIKDEKERTWCSRQIELYAASIQNIFLN